MDRSQSVGREIFANPQPVSGFELAGTRKKKIKTAKDV